MLHKKVLRILVIILAIIITSSCKSATPQSVNTLTPTSTATGTFSTPTVNTTPTLSAITSTPPPAATDTSTPGPELCDNTFFPSDDDTTWQYSGNNSLKGDYTRTDTILDSRDDGFTLGTELPDQTYQVEFVCTEAGLIDMDPLKSTLTAIFSNPSGKVIVSTTGISGLTFPRDIQPADTWQHYVNWEATSADSSTPGQFIYQYIARGLEVISVPYGVFDAMRLDVEIQIEAGSLHTLSGTYNSTIWLVPDLGIIKSEGVCHIPGVEFTDNMELVDFVSPP